MVASLWTTALDVAIAVLAIAVLWLVREVVALGGRVARIEGRLNGRSHE